MSINGGPSWLSKASESAPKAALTERERTVVADLVGVSSDVDDATLAASWRRTLEMNNDADGNVTDSLPADRPGFSLSNIERWAAVTLGEAVSEETEASPEAEGEPTLTTQERNAVIAILDLADDVSDQDLSKELSFALRHNRDEDGALLDVLPARESEEVQASRILAWLESQSKA